MRRLRETAGLTQEELASRAGLTARGISDLERGERRRPYPNTVRSLAEALGLSEHERAALAATVPGRGGIATTAAISEATALPVPPTRLVGREHDLQEIAELLRGAETRLVTLTGPGGIGKTRLALEVARDAVGETVDGVAFVALAPLRDADLVVPTISQALSLKEAVRLSPLDALCEHLREKSMLLVLDNFEHVAGAAPEVAVLIESCKDLTALVTSRAPLRVRGEQEYPVPTLGLPASMPSPDTGEVLGSPSGRLFVERARTVSPAFALTEETAGVVAAICRRLDGLPLALELAAARTRFLDPAALFGRLDRALSTGGARDLPERQRTMRAALDWSHDLLSEGEQILFRRLSVFAGGFGLEAAEAVGAVEDLEVEDTLDLLGRLVEQSLVVAEASLGEMRYRMLEPVRQYALEKLEESDEEAKEIRRRHAGYYLALGEQAGRELKGPEQPTWLGRLETELGNLRAAIGWAIEHEEIETLARTAWFMWKFWWLRGHQDEGRRWMEAALARKTSLLPALVRARLLFVAATLGRGLGDSESTQSLIEESLRLFRRLEDEPGIADALCTAGLIALGQNQYEEGLTFLEESADLNLKVGRKRAAGAMLGYAATVPLAQGDLAQAHRLAERSLSLSRESRGARDVVYVALHPMAAVARAEGDHERAARLLEESLMLSVEIGDESNVAYCLEGLAAVAAFEDKLERAARLWGAAEALLEATEIIAYPHASDRSLYQQQVADARTRLEEAVWERAWAQGRANTREQAIEYALEGHKPRPEPPRTGEDENRGWTPSH